MDTSTSGSSTSSNSTNSTWSHSASTTESISSSEINPSSESRGEGPETGENSSGDVDTMDDTDCRGLSAIKGEVWLEFAADKETLNGIECLDGDLYVLGTVGDLSGLENLKIILGDLNFANEGPLINAEGLTSLKRIGGLLQVGIYSGLEDFSGMENLESIGLGLYIWTGLKSVNGLQGVHHIEGSIFIGAEGVEGVPSFVSTKGLGGLKELGGSLRIYGTSIASLEGFEQIGKISGLLSLVDNQFLPTCIAKSLAEKTSPEEVKIKGNLADECGA